jgi:hypothetical protein
MKRQILISLILLSPILTMNAQTRVPNDGASPIWYYNNNVGIGITNPQSQLHIGGNTTSQISLGSISYGGNSGQAIGAIQVAQGDINGGILYFQVNPWNQTGSTGIYTPITRMTIDQYGNIGAGTTSPSSRLEIYNSAQAGHLVLSADDNPSADLTRIDIDFRVSNTGHTIGRIASFYENSASGGYGGLRFYTRYGGLLNERMRIVSNGYIGIGTTSPAYILDVIGTIRAREIKVDLNGADFVFEKDYKLMPLSELEKFVKEQKHLPEIATAKEMEQNGTELGDLNSKLLQKMEELTLYIIEQNKKIEALQNEIKKMKTASM